MAWEAMNEMLVPGWLERINPLMRASAARHWTYSYSGMPVQLLRMCHQ
jgi:hypothetical protein